MSSAYIHAERKIINDAANGIDTTGHIEEANSYQSPEDFYYEVTGREDLSEKDKLYSKALEVRKQLNEAIDNDDYKKAELLQLTLDMLEYKYNKL